MLEADLVRLRHMLDAAKEIAEFTNGKSAADLKKDRKLSLSVVRLLEIIGEAGAGVSEDFRKKHGQIPWKSVKGMRNRLIHGYFDVDLDIVWKTVEEDVPSLVRELERILKSQKE
jgi:uncharacterized protein with HEPN domain